MKSGLIALGAVLLFVFVDGFADTPVQKTQKYCSSLLDEIEFKCKSACPKKKAECILATYKTHCEGKEGELKSTKGCGLLALECRFECANLDKASCKKFENCQLMEKDKDGGLDGCFDKK